MYNLRPPTMSTETIEREKQFVANFPERQQQHVLPPDQIQQDSTNKQLGGSSRGLSVDNFELVKTLGTGASTYGIPWWTRDWGFGGIGGRRHSY